MDSYNLLDRSWIPVVDHEGHETSVGIRELLARPADFRGLAAPLGTVSFAIMRVLLAVLYRSWDSKKWRRSERAVEHWLEKWDQESLLDPEVEDYLSTWENRFDLRDKEHPFFQVAGLHTAKGEWKPLEIIFPDVGDEGDLFSMRDRLASVDAAEAAQAVVHCMAFDFSGIKPGADGDKRVKGGKGYPIGIGWCGWLGGTVIEGKNLRETLLLNYIPLRPGAGTEDRPLWKMEDIGPAARDGLTAPGPVELLTWPQRRILLHWDGDRVTGVLVTNGDAVDYTTQNSVETMSPWRFSEPQTKKAKAIRYMPQSLSVGKTMWRSLGGLFPNSAPEMTALKLSGEKLSLPKTEPAKNIDWVSTLIGQGALDSDRGLRVHMVSMEYGAQNSSFAGVAEDALTVRSAFLDAGSDALRAVARQAVQRADDVARLLWIFARNTAFAVSGNADEADTEGIQAAFYQQVDHRFRGWLRELGPDSRRDDVLADWSVVLRTTATGLAKDLLSAQGPDVWAGRWDGTYRITGAVAVERLRRGLRDCLGTDPRSTTSENGESK